MKITIVAAAVCAAFATCALASEKASAPEAGTYEAEVYVQSVSGSGCLDSAGFQFIGELSFGGLGDVTQTLRVPETGINLAIESVQVLTVKSGKGTTTMSGSLAWTGAGFGEMWNDTGTFSEKITEVGTHAFSILLKDSYTGCSDETMNISLVRTGVNQ